MIRFRDAMLQLEELCGYVSDSSEQVVTISQDDATRTFHLEVRGYGMSAAASARRYWGTSLAEVINKAWQGEKG